MTVPRVLVRCDGAEVPADLSTGKGTQRKAIASQGADADLNLNIQGLATRLVTRVADRSNDLVRIAAYVYAADQMVSRGGLHDVHGDRWQRHLVLCIPVLDLRFWRRAEVVAELTDVLRFLTEDRWEFHFSQGEPGLRQLSLEVQEGELLGKPNAVALVSGGVDSLCALLEASNQGQRPLVVCHWPAFSHVARQKALLARVRALFPTWAFPDLDFRIHRRGAEAADSSQRSRAFLYACLGAAVAGELGIEQVNLADNGVVSLNLPINAQLVGALASRSTHPKFLSGFNRFVAHLFSKPVRVVNPLRSQTRAETLEILKRTRCEPLLQETLSCSRWRGLPAATPQCGGCSQCVDRRFATIAAGLEEYDLAERYRRDIFRDDLPEGEDRTVAESYFRFAQSIYHLSDDDLILNYPQILDAVTADDPSPEATVAELIAMLKRHAESVIGAVKDLTARNLEVLVDGRLPATCLLRLAVGSSGSLLTAAPSGAQRWAEGGTPRQALGRAERRASEENLLACSGNVWTASFRNHTVHLKDAKGLHYLACLLGHPGRVFSPQELLAEAMPAASSSALTGDEAKAHGLRTTSSISAGKRTDRQALRAYEQTAKDLLRDVDEARSAGDSERVARLEEQIEMIVHEMKAAQGLGGRLRPFADEYSRAGNRVYRAIKRALDRIARAHPDLAQHLLVSVRRGATYAYVPDVATPWVVSLPKNNR